MTSALTTDHWYILSGVDAMTDAEDRASPSWATRSPMAAARRPTATIAGRTPLPGDCRKRRASTKVAVLNQGIGGNAVTSGGLGPTGLNRFRPGHPRTERGPVGDHPGGRQRHRLRGVSAATLDRGLRQSDRAGPGAGSPCSTAGPFRRSAVILLQRGRTRASGKASTRTSAAASSTASSISTPRSANVEPAEAAGGIRQRRRASPESRPAIRRWPTR